MGLQGQSIAQVNEFLRETGGLVKIEDILPLFPDFVQIDAFKDAICQSLEDYNQHIDQLKSEMADATRIADALRCCHHCMCLLFSGVSTSCCSAVVQLSGSQLLIMIRNTITCQATLLCCHALL